MPVFDQQVIVMLDMQMSLPRCSFTKCPSGYPTIDLPCSRIQALWQQQAWVAIDEMDFFLQATAVDETAVPFPPVSCHHALAAKAECEHWLQTPFSACAHSDGTPWFSAAIIGGHWVPVLICQYDQVIHFMTTPEGSCFVEQATALAQHQGFTPEILQRMFPQAFPADCGFQTLGWLLANLNDQPLEALPPNKAAQWRTLFARELLTQDKTHHTIHRIMIGGAIFEGDEMQQLATLLCTHGVWPDRVNERVNQVASKISAATLRNVLKSPRPWQDLKAAANNLKPIFKLIMADELNAQIAKTLRQETCATPTTSRWDL